MTAPREPVDVAGERAAVVAAARAWLGTPFAHGAALKGVGVDCAHLVMAAYAEAGVVPPFDVDAYAPDWFLHTDARLFAPHVRRHARRVAIPEAGNLALFRYGRGISHAAIVVDPVTVVHAFRGLGVVYGSLEPTHDLAPRLAGLYAPRRWGS